MSSKMSMLFLYLSFFIHFIYGVPERGVKDMSFDAKTQYQSFAKSLFKDAKITMSGEIGTDADGTPIELSLRWHLLQSNCAQYFIQVEEDMLPALIADGVPSVIHPLHTIYSNGSLPFKEGILHKTTITLEREILKQDLTKTRDQPGTANKSTAGTTDKPNVIPKGPTVPKERHKRDAPMTGPPRAAGIDGNYLIVISLNRELPKDVSVQVKVSIKMNTGYLSAAEWPLLPFYGAMSLVYLAYGVVWLIVSACQWSELLRIQFWIGGVIVLGMLEKAVLFSEYNNVNDTGVPAHGLVVFALVLSSIERTLSRILIIIISMGFGIVKPRLGAALHRVLGVGCLYFVLSVIEGSYREFSVSADVSRKQVIASVLLSVLDAVICWWIFMSLRQTMRTLRTSKNLVKLSLYRYFINILVVSFIASVAFMVWVIKAHSFNSCIQDWKEIWIDDAFWHFLFALILLAIMVLWRPTANNQRYASTPLIDVGEDDDDDMTLSDAFQGMKMRGKGNGEVPNRAEKQRKKTEDDLKWVEENIPTSGGIDTPTEFFSSSTVGVCNEKVLSDARLSPRLEK